MHFVYSDAQWFHQKLIIRLHSIVWFAFYIKMWVVFRVRCNDGCPLFPYKSHYIGKLEKKIVDSRCLNFCIHVLVYHLYIFGFALPYLMPYKTKLRKQIIYEKCHLTSSSQYLLNYLTQSQNQNHTKTRLFCCSFYRRSHNSNTVQMDEK